MNITVLGAGSWGIALAMQANINNHNVTLWEINKEAAKILDETREEKNKLPSIKIPKEISITSDIKTAVTDVDLIVVVVPSQFIRSTSKLLAGVLFSAKKIVVATKGIEFGTSFRMSEVLKDEVSFATDENIAVLSGPSHAEEVVKSLPTTVVSASKNLKLAQEIQKAFSSNTFRVYTNSDITGVELGAALKNVIAVAAGISDGLGFGDNAKAALMTRGIVEIGRLGEMLNAKSSTFLGLAGIGDLIVTCSSRHSRNRKLGEQIGKGLSLDEALKNMVMVAEGVETSKSAYELSQKFNVETPIIEQVYNILFKNKDPREAVSELMVRSFKNEEG